VAHTRYRTLAKLRAAPGVLRFAADFRTASFRADRRLARLGRTSKPIVAGPWRSEIGFEVLYWIPLLRWFAEEHGVERDRLIAVSRGGAGIWYGDVCGRSVDIFDHFSTEELKGWHTQQIAETGSQKQMRLRPFEREILNRAEESIGERDLAVLHPSVMYNLFRAYWAWRRPIGSVKVRTRFRPLPSPETHLPAMPGLDGLPDEYVAVKIYFSSCFPETTENRRFVAALLARLARNGNVVLLSTGLDLDDHSDYMSEGRERIFAIDHLVTPRNNLEVQSRIISGARGLVTTYGGFSYLGPFLGVPSCAFYSVENFVPGHVAVMRRATKVLRDQGQDIGFVTLHIRDFPIIDQVLGEPAREVHL
jgi:hypothetical protein